MVFSDLFFLFVFLPAFLLCYLLATWIDRKWQPTQENRTNQAKNLILVCFSLIFYAWGEPVYVFLMLFCVLVNYLVGLGIANSENHRKLVLTIGLILNIAIIGTFKYLGFLADCLNDLGLAVARPNIALPIGISFYTFQSISYLIDVYRRESPVQRRFIDLLLYISMFPQLIAGPIVRYGTVAEELHHRHVNAADFADGIYRFLIGLGKKVIIANQLSEISDQFLVSGLNSLTLAGAWIGIVAFTLQIYFDFSGYSDMAIGLGRCMGFHFNENFRHPYCCNSITDFWRRWHISLGSFFRDYVYIPLGGNRHHQAVNILVVWFLTGMWHGASWNFIIWGVYFGLIVMMEKYTLLRVHERIPAFVLHIYSMLLVIAGWGIFYFDNFDQMVVFFNAFFGNVASVYDFVDESALLDNFWLWVVALFFCLPVRTTIGEWTDRLLGDSNVKSVLVYSTRIVLSVAILILSTALLVGATNNAFIYTRF
ncbi:MAG: MBOAT family protein [Prevotella sp.]|jgi:alginate O-acetyltransferase complex protein AlgI|nr:MBOAT family protein [Prevotella sp.]